MFAPIGFLLGADEVIPELIERGKQQVQSARFFGQFAVQQGGVEAGKVIGKVQEQASGAAEVLSRRAGRIHPAPRSEARAPVPSSDGDASDADTAAVASGGNSRGDTSGLAIPDYDSLSASQVVPRLAGLSHDELEAVRAYEAEHRGRKTILNRVAQLQAS